MKKIEVTCECEGTSFIAVADNGGDGIEHVECPQHHPAYKADTGSLMGNILAAAKEIERLTSTDELLAHIGKQTGITSDFFAKTSANETLIDCPICHQSYASSRSPACPHFH